MFRVTLRSRYLRNLRFQEKPSDKMRAAEREEIKKIIETKSADFSTAHSTFTAFKSHMGRWLLMLGIGGLAYAAAKSVEYRKDEVTDSRRLAVKNGVT